jgi:hypothetical protein
MRKITCANCRATIDEAADLPERRQPCSNCSSTSRLFDVAIRCTVALDTHIQGRSKHRQPGRKKPVREEWFGHDFFRKKQRWSVIRRTVDYEHDWYEETFIDLDTGVVIHHCAEPLSEHRGHGSAKGRTRPT